MPSGTRRRQASVACPRTRSEAARSSPPDDASKSPAAVLPFAPTGGLMGYWDDYNAARPMTPGGEQRLVRSATGIRLPVAPPEPKIPDLPGLPPPVRPPKVKRQLTKLDLLIFVVVFVVAWIMLAASTMDAGNAAVFAVFAGAIASMWWRSLLRHRHRRRHHFRCCFHEVASSACVWRSTTIASAMKTCGRRVRSTRLLRSPSLPAPKTARYQSGT